ncbi:unnamed protein product [Cylindrotheca closterium]|uniref:Uncharacterized protein n=1 Tax=Cylindrotheca closterium TaxID=2856 RepID=A0AAD2CQK9_9STRA|nr:unnamed protein product [Cylindrotheca closterium]
MRSDETDRMKAVALLRSIGFHFPLDSRPSQVEFNDVHGKETLMNQRDPNSQYANNQLVWWWQTKVTLGQLQYKTFPDA